MMILTNLKKEANKLNLLNKKEIMKKENPGNKDKPSPTKGEEDVQKETTKHPEQTPREHPHGDKGDHNEQTPREHPHDVDKTVAADNADAAKI